MTLIAASMMFIPSHNETSSSWSASESAMFSFGRFADSSTDVASYMLWELPIFVIIGCMVICPMYTTTTISCNIFIIREGLSERCSTLPIDGFAVKV